MIKRGLGPNPAPAPPKARSIVAKYVYEERSPMPNTTNSDKEY